MGQGVTKKCGEDFIKVEVPRTAKVRKLRIKDKGKGVGKKSNKARGTPGHDSAQDPDILDIEISKAETENLYVDNNNKSKAGPSGRVAKWVAKREERGRRKEKDKETDKTGGKADYLNFLKRAGLNSSTKRAHQMPRMLKKKTAHTNSWCTDSPVNSWKAPQVVPRRRP